MPTRTARLPIDLARQLLAFEATQGGGLKGSAALSVCAKMREPLGKVLGVDGFRSLVARALAMAGSEVRWLREINIAPDGVVHGVDEVWAKLSHTEIQEGEIALVAELLGLLVIFIGPYLTERLLHASWPKLRSLNSKTEGAL